MFRKIVCMLAVFLWLPVGMLVRASGKEGSVRVCPDWGGDLIPGGTVKLYRVGEPVEGGYRITDGLADWTVWEQDVDSREVREWILGQEFTVGISAGVDWAEGALVSGLTAGLYLVTQGQAAPGFLAFSPELVRIPQEGFWDVGISPQVLPDTEPPKTADHPAPIIGAMGLGFSVAALMVLVDGRKDK